MPKIRSFRQTVNKVAAAYIDKAYGKDAKGGLPGGRLYVRAAEEEVGGDVEEVAEFYYLLVVALIDAFFIALVHRLGNAEISRNLHLRHIAAEPALFHTVSH